MFLGIWWKNVMIINLLVAVGELNDQLLGGYFVNYYCPYFLGHYFGYCPLCFVVLSDLITTMVAVVVAEKTVNNVSDLPNQGHSLSYNEFCYHEYLNNLKIPVLGFCSSFLNHLLAHLNSIYLPRRFDIVLHYLSERGYH